MLVLGMNYVRSREGYHHLYSQVQDIPRPPPSVLDVKVHVAQALLDFLLHVIHEAGRGPKWSHHGSM